MLKFLKKAKGIVLVSIVFISLLHAFSSHAWNAMGHMLVAQIAYDKLNPDVKKKVDALVGQLAKDYPEITSFHQLGPWPDAIKSQKIDIFSHWHYTNLAFSLDGTPLKKLEDTDNVVWAIAQIEPIVANNKANPAERARFLALLVHLVADIHQPLHTTALISATMPDGDRGGNLYHIKFPASKPQTITLHKLWDQGIDLFTNEASTPKVNTLSAQITNLYPEKYFGQKVKDLNAEHWAAEGLSTAMSTVYSTPENQIPSESYLRSGRDMAEQKVALAGYRLAAMLNQILA